MIRRPPRSTQSRSSAASDVYKRQLLSQVGGPVADGVALLLRRHVQGRTHALAGLLVPALALGIDAGSLPELLLQLIRTGVVATADEERLGGGQLLHRLVGALGAPDL